MNKTKILWGVVVILILVFGIYWLNQPNESEAIKIGTFSKAIDYAPYLVAKNKGWFDDVAEKHGTTIEYNEFQSLPSINEAFATNNIDMVFEAEAPAIVGRAAGIDLKIVGTGVFLTQEIIVPINSNIKTVSDLRGKKVAVLAGTSAHQGLVKVLNQNGLSLDDVEIIDMLPPDAKAAFELSQVDAWAVWPPFPQQEEVAGKGKSLNGSEIFIQSVIVSNEKFLEEHPEINKDLLEVIKQTQTWILQNEAEAQTIVATELDLDEEVVIRSWPKHDFNASLGEEEIRDIQSKADFLYEQGLIKNRVNVDDLVEI